MRLQEHLLAHHLRRQQPVGQIGQVVVGIQMRPFRHRRRQRIDQTVQPIAGGRADHEGLLERRQRGQRRGQRQQRTRRDQYPSCSAPASSAAPPSPASRRSRAPPRWRRPWHRPAARAGRRRARRSRRPPPSRGPACAAGGRCPACPPAGSGSPPRIRIPSTRNRVVCALGETIDSFAPVSRLSSVDFPAFGAPTIATNPQRGEVIGARSATALRPQAVRRRACCRRFRSRWSRQG